MTAFKKRPNPGSDALFCVRPEGQRRIGPGAGSGIQSRGRPVCLPITRAHTQVRPYWMPAFAGITEKGIAGIFMCSVVRAMVKKL